MIKAIKSSLRKAIDFFKNELSDFFNAALNTIKSGGGRILVNAAIAAVTAAEKSGGSGRDKFEAAYKSVLATLAAEGIPLVENAVRLAIEAAVANLRK